MSCRFGGSACVCRCVGCRRSARRDVGEDVVDRRIDGNPWQCQRIGGTGVVDRNTISRE